MPLPETIPVRYTEEEADNFSIRPVKRQTFRLRELVDMILRVTGKDQARVQQILKSGTLVYHFFDTGGRDLRLMPLNSPHCFRNFPEMTRGARFAPKDAR